MKVWLAQPEGQRRYRPFLLAAGVVGLALLTVSIAAGAAVLAVYSPRGELLSLLGCIFAVALGILLAGRLGSWSAEGNTLFWLDGQDRLFALDTRAARPYRGAAGFFLREKDASAQVQAALRQLAAGAPPAGIELAEVLRVTPRRRGWTVRARVRYPGGGEGERSFFLPDRVDGGEELLQILDRKRRGEGPEVAGSRWPGLAAGAGVTLAGLAALCAFSHPAVGKLPEKIYFPALGGAFLALFVLVYAILKHKRGE